MKFAVALLAFAASALAQHIEISSPSSFASVKPGSKITVEIGRPNSLTASTEVGIAIGLWPCGGPKGTSRCTSTDVSQVLGNVVYTGSYKPEYDTKAPSKPPHQTFEVTVPSSFSKGEVSLGVAHLSLVGAGAEPTYQFANITLVVS
ncbi:hypothetical protein GSI_15631 [Ganoderma sinense ZZ0214-1]|uniref:Uncharacterized protein n=1 Tax=Ganoderma sinense ZZ0214-1 TaxID=1077348 RepID=A0A2G8RN42_9APHY|nr:hypothetical protein GSI_15631 [Ganoderma sinense ZZ0214-1]